uniref:Uncharacterized protein n=1 Tax=Rhizophora mucronata TaxID=61149 RepID=A0A2P2K3N9_RHIMU
MANLRGLKLMRNWLKYQVIGKQRAKKKRQETKISPKCKQTKEWKANNVKKETKNKNNENRNQLEQLVHSCCFYLQAEASRSHGLFKLSASSSVT